MNDKKYSNFFLSVTCRCNNNQNIFPYYYFWLCVNSAHFIRKILYLFLFFCWTHNISRLLPLEFCNRVWQVQFRYQRKKKYARNNELRGSNSVHLFRYSLTYHQSRGSVSFFFFIFFVSFEACEVLGDMSFGYFNIFFFKAWEKCRYEITAKPAEYEHFLLCRISPLTLEFDCIFSFFAEMLREKKKKKLNRKWLPFKWLLIKWFCLIDCSVFRGEIFLIEEGFHHF